MNQELQKQIASLVESANKAGVDLVTFIQQQSPDLFQQLLRWKITDAVFSLVWETLVLSGICYCFKRALAIKIEDDLDLLPKGIAVAGLAFLGLIISYGFFCDAQTIAQCFISPKVEIIKALIHFTK